MMGLASLKDDGDLPEKLTIILVTSPILSHPSTELLEKVVATFDFVPQLCRCSLLVIADGVKVGKFRPKRGQVPEDLVVKYEDYLDNLDLLVEKASPCDIWSRTSVIRLPEHRGFGHAVLKGLELSCTEYVLVVQHDHPFTASFRLNPVISFMEEKGANYVCLPISTVFRHINRCSSLYQMDLRAKSVVTQEGARFTPLLFWYDGTHIARRSAYLSLVFQGELALPLGHFIEDTFSQAVMGRLREDFSLWFPTYSMWVFQPNHELEQPLILHLDGRNYRTDEDRKSLGWNPNPVLRITDI